MKTNLGVLHLVERGEGRPVVLWPSLFCDGTMFDDLAATLEADHRVLVIDGPGHGKSEAVRVPYAWERHARALGEVLDDRGVERATLIGAAWGGMVAVDFASEQPARVDGLVIMNAPLDAWRGKQRALMWTLVQLLRMAGARRCTSLAFGPMVAPAIRDRDPARYAALTRAMREGDQRSIASVAASVMLGRPSLLSRLPRITAPTLVITGADDELYPAARARAEVADLRGARVVEVPGTTHLSCFEAPDRVHVEVRRFLAETRAPARERPPEFAAGLGSG